MTTVMDEILKLSIVSPEFLRVNLNKEVPNDL